MPLAMAGALQDPPVSSHRAQGAKRAAVEAAEPALLPGQPHIMTHAFPVKKHWLCDRDLATVLPRNAKETKEQDVVTASDDNCWQVHLLCRLSEIICDITQHRCCKLPLHLQSIACHCRHTDGVDDSPPEMRV